MLKETMKKYMPFISDTNILSNAIKGSLNNLADASKELDQMLEEKDKIPYDSLADNEDFVDTILEIFFDLSHLLIGSSGFIDLDTFPVIIPIPNASNYCFLLSALAYDESESYTLTQKKISKLLNVIFSHNYITFNLRKPLTELTTIGYKYKLQVRFNKYGEGIIIIDTEDDTKDLIKVFSKQGYSKCMKALNKIKND